MANEMNSYVVVNSHEAGVFIRLKEIFKSEDNHCIDAVDIINNLEGTNYSYVGREYCDNKPPFDIWDSIIGPKWMRVDFNCDAKSDEIVLIINSANWVPVNFLKRLRKELSFLDKDSYLYGIYMDESYDPSGAFIYGEDDYETMEDIDEEFDWKKNEKNELYLESWHDKLLNLRSELIKEYNDFINNEQAVSG